MAAWNQQWGPSSGVWVSLYGVWKAPQNKEIPLQDVTIWQGVGKRNFVNCAGKRNFAVHKNICVRICFWGPVFQVGAYRHTVW